MKHEEHIKAVYFKGGVLKVGNSLMVTIPKANADYLGINEGATIEAKITRVESCPKGSLNAQKKQR